MKECENCEGQGYTEGYCYACNGSGEGCADGTTCRRCKGSGSDRCECEECGGTGEIDEE